MTISSRKLSRLMSIQSDLSGPRGTREGVEGKKSNHTHSKWKPMIGKSFRMLLFCKVAAHRSVSSGKEQHVLPEESYYFSGGGGGGGVISGFRRRLGGAGTKARRVTICRRSTFFRTTTFPLFVIYILRSIWPSTSRLSFVNVFLQEKEPFPSQKIKNSSNFLAVFRALYPMR